MKWTSEGLKKKEVKLVEDLLHALQSQHNTYRTLTNHWDGTKAVESLSSASWEIFGHNVRPDLNQKIQEVYDSCQGKLTPANYADILSRLQAVLTWAKENVPVKDQRRPEAELKEQWEKGREREAEAKRKEEEFNQKATEIPTDKRGVVLEICFDNSDAMSDYFDRHHTIEAYLLAIIPEGREDERNLRTVIERIPALKEIPFEWHTEKYSMGHGNYLESKTTTETRTGEAGRQIQCHYEIRYRKTYGKPTRVIPHPQWFLGEVQGGSNGGNGKETVLEMTIRENKEMNGVEILFPSKPSRAVIETLKNHGFRWSFKQGLWWKRNSPGLIERIEQALKGSSGPSTSCENPEEGSDAHNNPGTCVDEVSNPV